MLEAVLDANFTVRGGSYIRGNTALTGGACMRLSIRGTQPERTRLRTGRGGLGGYNLKYQSTKAMVLHTPNIFRTLPSDICTLRALITGPCARHHAAGHDEWKFTSAACPVELTPLPSTRLAESAGNLLESPTFRIRLGICTAPRRRGTWPSYRCMLRATADPMPVHAGGTCKIAGMCGFQPGMIKFVRFFQNSGPYPGSCTMVVRQLA